MNKSISKTDQKIIAIHQPNYIPWLGYFYKMAKCDIFVYLDTVQFPRGQSFAARNRIKTHNGTTWLTIPTSIPSGQKGKATYREVSIAGNKWKRKHLKTIEMNYKKAPYFEEIFEIYKKRIEEDLSLTDLNIQLIEGFADYLKITSKRILLSELLGHFGEKTQLIVDICKALHGNTYLSGTGGGKDYNDESLLNDQGIALQYSTFKHPEYPQLWDGFEHHLSIIDLLMNCGPQSREILEI